MTDIVICVAVRVGLIAVLTFSLAPVARGQTSTDEQFTLHGYLTQAYARSNSLPIQGITKTGRADYRLMVLQIRYALSNDDEFVTQLRHRHFGASPLSQIEPEIAVSWAFYQRRLGPVNVRVGRVPLEQGLYNETRYVGTLVPFFRAPIGIYPEGIESIDGATVSYRTPSFAGWSAQTTLSGGTARFDDVASIPGGTLPIHLFYYLDYTAQGWVNTPISGVRVGTGVHSFAEKSDTTKRHFNQAQIVSVDATFERFFLRGEHVTYRIPTASAEGMAHYVQGGIEVIGPLWLTYQYDFTHSDLQSPSGTVTQANHDRAAGVIYAISPNVHLKGERHLATGYRFDQFLPPGSPGKTNYTIVSFSVSF